MLNYATESIFSACYLLYFDWLLLCVYRCFSLLSERRKWWRKRKQKQTQRWEIHIISEFQYKIINNLTQKITINASQMWSFLMIRFFDSAVLFSTPASIRNDVFFLCVISCTLYTQYFIFWCHFVVCVCGSICLYFCLVWNCQGRDSRSSSSTYWP